MKIAILAPRQDSDATALVASVLGWQPGAVCVHLDLQFGATTPITMDAQDIHCDGHRLTSFDAVLVRGFEYMDPVVPNSAVGADWSVWQIDYMIDQQRFSSQYSLLEELARRGVEVMNPPRAHLHGFQRSQLLNVIADAGISVPSVLCTNDPAAASAFCAENGQTVWRPATGRASWQRFTRRQQDAFVTSAQPPVMLASVADGGMVRCWLLRGRPLLCLTHAPADAGGLERTEALWALEPARVGARTLAPICALLGAPWLQVTYAFDGSEPVVYDIDFDPRLDWLPPLHRGVLITRLAAGLSGSTVDDTVPAGVQQRPTPLLRRMLRDLFDYESSKYPDQDPT